MKGNVERQPMKKMLNVYSNAILNFISVKYIYFKGWCAIYIFCKTLAFDCEESIALVLCEKYLVQTFGLALMSSSLFHSKKHFLT